MRRIHRCALLAASTFLFLACSFSPEIDFTYEQPPSVSGTPQNFQLFFSMASDSEEFLGPTAGRPGHEFRSAMDALFALPAPDGGVTGATGGAGAFLISAGDVAPASGFREALDDRIGTSLIWYNALGNHEAGSSDSMTFLRAYAANYAAATNYSPGPPGAEQTCYSFDAGPAHFTFINEYYDGASDTGESGNVVPALLAWLKSDLDTASARSPDYIFVVGHEPILPMPDAFSGRLRHRGDSLDAHPGRTKAFLQVMQDHDVSAYICGHSHGYSTWLIDGILQIDTGHARGEGDTGAPSTFLRMSLYDNMAVLETYRNFKLDGIHYSPTAVLRILPRSP